jgi:hypothetical protein
MIKEKAREYIDLYLQNLIKELRIELDDKVKASVMQCSDVNNIDSHSHQFQTLKDEQNVNDRLNHIIEEQVYFQNISTLKMAEVQEGALIEIKNIYIYVGIVTPLICNKEKNIIGISTAAPIFKTLQNQSVGFPFEFAGVNCEILSIK